MEILDWKDCQHRPVIHYCKAKKKVFIGEKGEKDGQARQKDNQVREGQKKKKNPTIDYPLFKNIKFTIGLILQKISLDY